MAQVAAVRPGAASPRLRWRMWLLGTVCTGALAVAVPAGAQDKKPSDYHGFYVGGNLGYALPSEVDLSTRFTDSTPRPKDEIDFDSGGVSASVRAGYEYRFLRGEAELHTQLLVGDDVKVTNPNTTGNVTQTEVDGTQVFNAFFTNAFIEAPLDIPVKPYIGGGIGVGVLATGDDTDTAIGINGQAGMTWDMSPRMALDANYRYTHFGEMSSSTNFDTRTSFQDHDGHAFEVGIRYRFGDMSRPATPRAVRPATQGPVKSDYDFPTRNDLGRMEQASMTSGQSRPVADRPPAFEMGGGIPSDSAEPLQRSASPRLAPSETAPRPEADPYAPLPLDGSGLPRPATSATHWSGAGVAATSSGSPPSRPMGVAGRMSVQLASFSNRENAERGWGELSARHRDLLAGLRPEVVSVDIPGKGRFHRLYAAGLDGAGAERVCRLLKQRGAGCRVSAR